MSLFKGVTHRSKGRGPFTTVCEESEASGPGATKIRKALATHRPAGVRRGSMELWGERAHHVREHPIALSSHPPLSCRWAPPVGQTQLEAEGQIHPVWCSRP